MNNGLISFLSILPYSNTPRSRLLKPSDKFSYLNKEKGEVISSLRP